MTPDDESRTRAELVEGYAHPYRRWLPIAYRMSRDHWVLAVAALLTLVTLVIGLTGDVSDELVVLDIAVVITSLLRAAKTTVEAAVVIRRLTATWRPDPTSELDAVRRRRPHAGEVDAGYAHDEYAVSVEGGELVTWCFVPLAFDGKARRGETLVPGVPRYAAAPAHSQPFDARDTARAAEQLVDAQTAAAEWEATAAREAAVAWAQRETAGELAAETESTGAALRRLTGQDRRE